MVPHLAFVLAVYFFSIFNQELLSLLFSIQVFARTHAFHVSFVAHQIDNDWKLLRLTTVTSLQGSTEVPLIRKWAIFKNYACIWVPVLIALTQTM